MTMWNAKILWDDFVTLKKVWIYLLWDNLGKYYRVILWLTKEFVGWDSDMWFAMLDPYDTTKLRYDDFKWICLTLMTLNANANAIWNFYL